MTARFQMGLAILGALALGCVLLILLQDEGTSRDLQAPDLTTAVSEDQPGDLEGVDGVDPDASHTSGGDAPVLQPAPQPRGPDSLVGLREPAGIDLSDPVVREKELRRMLTTPPIEWLRLSKIVAIMQPGETIPADLRPVILDELRSGKRLQVMHVFSNLRDASFVEDLFDVIENGETSAGHERAALEALWKMPGGDDDEIARRLEGRLTNDVRKDASVLRAIGKRGGAEAARAMVEYLQRVQNPLDVRAHILQSLDLSTDKAAAAVVSQALQREGSPKVQKALIEMASRSGATAMSAPLIALDRNGVTEEVRSRAIVALGRIGDEASTTFLLRKAAEPGAFGEQALRAVALIRSADPRVGDRLARALAEADQNPRPARAKASLLQALGSAQHVASLPVVVRSLNDSNRPVQEAAVNAMGRMGHHAQTYVPKLVRLYDGGDARMQQKIAVALGDIGGSAAVREMRRMLKKPKLSLSVKRTLQLALRNAERELGDK